MNTTFKAITAAALAGMILFPMSSPGSGYLKIGDIKGESTDNAHNDWIIIESFDMGIQLQRDAASGLPTGKRQHKPVTITKSVDKSSPKLMEAITTGRVIPMVRLELVTPGTRTLYYQIVMKNVLVSSYQTGGSSGAAAAVESVGLDYEEVKWTYTQFDPKGGTVRDHSYYWDLLAEAGETDELPPGSFRVGNAGSTSPGGKVLMLEWEGFQEFHYVIKTSKTADGVYAPLQTYDPLEDGKQELELPIGAANLFIQIEKVRESIIQQ